jgi:hypothetical protein
VFPEQRNFKKFAPEQLWRHHTQEIFAMTSPVPQWLYLPPVDSADVFHSHDDGTRRIECYTNLKSAGAIEYRYMVGVYPSGSMKPLLLVTSETSAGLELSNPGEFALGVFLPNGHRTLDVAAEYGQGAYFFEKAAAIVESFLADSPSLTA